MKKNTATKVFDIKTGYREKTIKLLTPLANHISRDIDNTGSIIIYYVKNYLEKNPTPAQYLEDLRKYRKLFNHYKYEGLKRVTSPFYRDNEWTKDMFYNVKRNDLYSKILDFLQKLYHDNTYYNEIEGWSYSLNIDNHVYLHVNFKWGIENVIQHQKQVNLDLFLPPMIYAEIREELA